MTTATEIPARSGNTWRIVGWGAALALLLMPLVAMQFTREVDWTGEDFAAAALLIGIPGLLFELIVRTSRHWAFRLGAAIALLACFFMTWSNLAVGIVGNEGNPVNQLFFAIVLIALLGSAIARLRPRGMTYAMLTTAVAQGAVGIGLLFADWVVLPFTGFMMAAWLTAAWLFNRAAKDGA